MAGMNLCNQPSHPHQNIMLRITEILGHPYKSLNFSWPPVEESSAQKFTEKTFPDMQIGQAKLTILERERRRRAGLYHNPHITCLEKQIGQLSVLNQVSRPL